ncbi:MAG: tetratricopeptide repeat protein [Planctomycetota bacterium]|jgi:hypothetical protein
MEEKKLKYRLYVFVVITTFMVFATAGLGIESPIGSSLGPPISNPTIPQSSLSPTGSELIPTRGDGYGAGGNRIVTGNVSNGREFEHADGIVPYRSVAEYYPSDFELATSFGSGPLTSFIRRSAGFGYPDADLRLNQPYNLSSQRVRSLRYWYESGLVPPEVTLPEDTKDFAQALEPISDSQYLYDQQRPLSRNLEELEDIISREIELQKLAHQEEEPLEEDEELAAIEELLAQQFRKTDEKKDESSDEIPEIEKPIEPQKPLEQTTQEDTESEEQSEDFLEQLRQEQERFEEENADILGADKEDETEDKAKGKNELELKVGEKLELGEVDHAKAAKIRGSHKTFKEWAAAKFAEYIKAAEEFLKEGKYYKAADAYTLASIYEPENALAYGGKALALFAAGEYMSSSYFLERAITLSPEYAKNKIDLVAMLVDRDMIENNIIEMATWQQQSKSHELAFLMTFIFYQNNQIPAAKVAATFAFEKMKFNPAFKSLTQAINIADLKTK